MASRQPPAQALRTHNFATPASRLRLRLAPAASQRCYSENTAAKEEAPKEQAETQEAPKQDATAENPLKAELETKKEQNKDLTVWDMI
jgi:copper oxidase (laccase) domain-containing protein